MTNSNNSKFGKAENKDAKEKVVKENPPNPDPISKREKNNYFQKEVEMEILGYEKMKKKEDESNEVKVGC